MTVTSKCPKLSRTPLNDCIYLGGLPRPPVQKFAAAVLQYERMIEIERNDLASRADKNATWGSEAKRVSRLTDHLQEVDKLAAAVEKAIAPVLDGIAPLDDFR